MKMWSKDSFWVSCHQFPKQDSIVHLWILSIHEKLPVKHKQLGKTSSMLVSQFELWCVEYWGEASDSCHLPANPAETIEAWQWKNLRKICVEKCSALFGKDLLANNAPAAANQIRLNLDNIWTSFPSDLLAGETFDLGVLGVQKSVPRFTLQNPQRSCWHLFPYCWQFWWS